jgi:hypothetical protein
LKRNSNVFKHDVICKSFESLQSFVNSNHHWTKKRIRWVITCLVRRSYTHTHTHTHTHILSSQSFWQWCSCTSTCIFCSNHVLNKSHLIHSQCKLFSFLHFVVFVNDYFTHHWSGPVQSKYRVINYLLVNKQLALL